MPQPKVARRRAATVVDSEHGRRGGTHELSIACDGSRARRHDGVVDAASRAIGPARRAARFRSGSIGRAADRRTGRRMAAISTTSAIRRSIKSTPSNVAELKGVWRARLRGSGVAPKYSGEGATRRPRRRRVHQHGRERRVRAVARHAARFSGSTRRISRRICRRSAAAGTIAASRSAKTRSSWAASTASS